MASLQSGQEGVVFERVVVRPRRTIKDLLVRGLDEDEERDYLMFEGVRAWVDGDGVSIEVVDGRRRLVGRLNPLEALELASLLIDYVLDVLSEREEHYIEALERAEAELGEALKSLEEPKVVLFMDEVESEVNHLASLYRRVLSAEEVLNALGRLNYAEVHKFFTIAYQVLKYY